ncbi:MAG TPA: hypothetical protein VIG52_12195 [Methyloceanibacter sp.]
MNIRLTAEEAHDIDDERSLQKPLTSRSAMVKQLVREALDDASCTERAANGRTRSLSEDKMRGRELKAGHK